MGAQFAEWTLACPYCHTQSIRISGIDFFDTTKPKPEPFVIARSFECMAGHKWKDVLAQQAGGPVINAMTDERGNTLNMAELNAQFEQAEARKRILAPLTSPTGKILVP